MEIKTRFNFGDKVWKVIMGFSDKDMKATGYVPMGLTIGKVEVVKTVNCSYKGESSERCNQVETYMCPETGVGSGAVYRTKDLYTSQAATQKECDRLNAMWEASKRRSNQNKEEGNVGG